MALPKSFGLKRGWPVGGGQYAAPGQSRSRFWADPFWTRTTFWSDAG